MKKSKRLFNDKERKYYKLYDENGNEIGTIDPLFEKKQSNWLKGVSIFILTTDGNLVLEKRTKNTKLTPGDIDLVSGHVDGDEKRREAAYREIREEIGIKKKQILKLKKIKSETPLVFKGGRNFFINFYVTKLKKDKKYLQFQENEVEDIIIKPMEEGFDMIRNGQTKFPYIGNENKFEEIFDKVRIFYKKNRPSKNNKYIEKNEGEQK